MDNKTIRNKKVVTIVAVAFSIAMAFLILTSHTKQVDASTSGKYRTINGFFNTDGTVDTTDGMEWKVRKASYAYPNTTKVIVKFDTCGTKNKLDDKIVSIKAQSKNLQLINNYLVKNYDLRAFKVKYIKSNKLTEKMIANRAINHTIYVEIIKSVSKGGKRGLIDGKYTIAYNKSVKKGKKVTSYNIWNPDNAYVDDVIAVVDNGKIR